MVSKRGNVLNFKVSLLLPHHAAVYELKSRANGCVCVRSAQQQALCRKRGTVKELAFCNQSGK